MNAQVSFQGFILRPAPEVRWYLEFSPGFTAMSLFVPLVACWAAFYFLGNQDELKVWRICLAGVMCGGMSMSRPFQVIGRPVEKLIRVTCGFLVGLMHYSASFQQPLYNVDYKASLPTRVYTAFPVKYLRTVILTHRCPYPGIHHRPRHPDRHDRHHGRVLHVFPTASPLAGQFLEEDCVRFGTRHCRLW